MRMFVFFFIVTMFSAISSAQLTGTKKRVLDQAEASHFAQLALKCVTREYPNNLTHSLESGADVRSPKELHPVFYGCYDWHSSVHGHWLLAHLLRLFPTLPEGPAIRAALNANLTLDNIRAEVAYFDAAGRRSFERPYGWAWLLKLHEELFRSQEPDAKRWFAAVQPLADGVVRRYVEFFPKQTYSIRVGTHFNTAFALGFAYDYAAAVGNADLKKVVVDTGRRYFASDKNYPAWIEPNGDDFLPSSLVEADLMRRIMPAGEFATWFRKFLPGIASGKPSNLLAPAVVSDRTDPKLVHLDGLNLSRAWCMREIAAALPAGSPERRILIAAARLHSTDALKNVASGNYEGEHWLATFAVYMLGTPDVER